MKGDPLPPDHHVARLCRISDLIFTTKGLATGVMETVFRPRVSADDEVDGLSAYWLEFFKGDRHHNIISVLSVLKSVVKQKQCLIILNVGQLAALGIQVVEDPIEELPPRTNAAHVLIRGLSDDKIRHAVSFLVQPEDLIGVDGRTLLREIETDTNTAEITSPTPIS